MIDQLFGSKTRVKLLQLFYSNPNRSFFVREITRKIDEQINSVRRELANLLSIGIIISKNENNKLFYEVNPRCEYNGALSNIFANKKNVGNDSPDNSNDMYNFKSLGHIDLALLTGQFTHDEISGVDLLIVGDINKNKMDKFILELESKENKAIRYAVMDLDEYNYREQVKDRFISNIIKSKKQVLIDKSKVLLDQDI
jgi:hypothetical protein